MVATIECEFAFSMTQHKSGSQSIARTRTMVLMPANSDTVAQVVVLLPDGRCEVTQMIQRLDV